MRHAKVKRSILRKGRTILIPHALNPNWWCCPVHGAMPNDSSWVATAITSRGSVDFTKVHHYVAYHRSLPHPVVVEPKGVIWFEILCPYEPHLLRGYAHPNLTWKLTPGRRPQYYTPGPGEEIWPVLAALMNGHEAVNGGKMDDRRKKVHRGR